MSLSLGKLHTKKSYNLLTSLSTINPVSSRCMSQVVNKFEATCNKFYGSIRLVTRVSSTLIQNCCDKISIKLTTQGCNSIVIT